MNFNLKKVEKHTHPFPYAIIENPFEEAENIERDFPSMDNVKSSLRMDKDITYPSEIYLNLLSESAVYAKIHNTIYSSNFISEIINLFQDEIKINLHNKKLLVDPFRSNLIGTPLETVIQSYGKRVHSTKRSSFFYPRIDLGAGGAGYGLNNGGAGIHTDNETRLISILYYVNTPEKMKGGDHRLYEIANKSPLLHRAISPKRGVMIASLQTNYALHDVDPIITIDGYRKAFYIAISCNNQLWTREEDWLMKLTKNRAGELGTVPPLPIRIKSKIKRKLSKILQKDV